MSRINTNVTSLIAQRSLAKNNASLATSLQRLSTGLKINSGADDPAGLIASENLKAEQTGLSTAIDNAGRASNIIGTAEGGLNEVSNLLDQLGSLVNQSANSGGLSAQEVQANQLQVDSILNTINRISGATSFQGKHLLDGTLGYTTSSAAASAFSSLQINAANLVNGATQQVVVQVANSATIGKLSHVTAGVVGLGAAASVTIEIAGNNGTQQLSFAGSSTYAQIITAINGISASTGVVASAISTSGIAFKAASYGADQFVSVKAIAGAFATTGSTSGKAFGTDAKVNVNGAAAQVNGLNVNYRNNNLDFGLTLSAGLNAGQTKTFGVNGGGATFNLGSKVTETNKANIGIQSVSTGSLGDSVNGFLASLASGRANSLSSGNLAVAQKILDESILQVSTLRGRLGAFQKYTLDSTINSLGVAYENASSANSAIRDTDFAKETSNLTRAQILSQSATTVLAQANAAPQQALTLLRGG